MSRRREDATHWERRGPVEELIGAKKSIGGEKRREVEWKGVNRREEKRREEESSKKKRRDENIRGEKRRGKQ